MIGMVQRDCITLRRAWAKRDKAVFRSGNCSRLGGMLVFMKAVKDKLELHKGDG